MRPFQYIPLVLLFCFFIGCTPEKKEQPKVIAIDPQKIKEQFVKANKQQVQKESDEMDYYVKTHHQPFINTNSGIRYFVYGPSAKGDSIREGDEIMIDFTVSLLDGTLCYSSKESGSRSFIVGSEDIESGIHKGVQYLKNGDKALLILPSYLAHGLLGDMKKIPPRMPIVYDVQVLFVKKRPS